jgi:hypothetical protein
VCLCKGLELLQERPTALDLGWVGFRRRVDETQVQIALEKTPGEAAVFPVCLACRLGNVAGFLLRWAVLVGLGLDRLSVDVRSAEDRQG